MTENAGDKESISKAMDDLEGSRGSSLRSIFSGFNTEQGMVTLRYFKDSKDVAIVVDTNRDGDFDPESDYKRLLRSDETNEQIVQLGQNLANWLQNGGEVSTELSVAAVEYAKTGRSR